MPRKKILNPVTRIKRRKRLSQLRELRKRKAELIAKAVEHMKNSTSRFDRMSTYTLGLFHKSQEYQKVEDWFKEKPGYPTLTVAKNHSFGQKEPKEINEYPHRYSNAMKEFEKRMLASNIDLENAH
ncbi:MAG: hypothetical protein COV47_00050 [Candidatus Diapherotrites archaeon CG11_big_fil_rev_8_21_14_0_20_37_9]|nr:MAG: hypothetical protein COV47_00050 [Candidatus Diapherotrites archaeon CG11_big_fil_rev_8_21_14_0_20_37_9]